MMGFDEQADLIGSCQASLDTLGLLVGDMSEEIQDGDASLNIAQILNHLLDTERRYYGRVKRMRKELRPKMRMLPIPITTSSRRFGRGRSSTSWSGATRDCCAP